MLSRFREHPLMTKFKIEAIFQLCSISRQNFIPFSKSEVPNLSLISSEIQKSPKSIFIFASVPPTVELAGCFSSPRQPAANFNDKRKLSDWKCFASGFLFSCFRCFLCASFCLDMEKDTSWGFLLRVIYKWRSIFVADFQRFWKILIIW